ncbi:MAG: asparagine synthase (glutamine-hydrolyzing), partial [Verrucomicrobia bacterium]|nr:asparagine synthase (glutamine-hydrolyzing) [Verrucomicrobiota bacterium]
MCGIAGYIYRDAARPADEATVAGMCAAIVHRGPDDQGTYVARNVALGARRLSIIDLEGGHQPIHNEDKTISVAFNGEIYNYRELTELLKRRGHVFSSQSDTEVLVHAYEEFGDEFLQHLNGMFAIALWDQPRQRLLLARDRTGIKPLYIGRFDNALIFGSEIKAILAYPRFPRHIDLVALNEYLSFEYVPTPRSIFQDITKLPPGHMMIVTADGNQHLTQYWDVNLARSEGIQSKRIADYAHELLEVFEDVVRKEMISDVPIGVLLSGGIDSSAVAAMMTKLSPGNVNSFSISFDDPSFDESQHAKAVADHLGTHHHDLRLTPQRAVELLPRIADQMDEPLGDGSLVPTFLLSQFTREHVKAALGGDGGDEIFGGYSTLQAHRLVQYYEKFVPGFVRLRLIPALVSRMPVSYDNISFDFKVRRFIGGRGLPPIVRHQRWLGSFTPEQKAALVMPSVRLQEKDAYDIAFQHIRACQASEPLNQILYADMKLYMEGDILPKVDRASMANSLEVRVPFLNHTMVEHVAKLPHQLKLRGMTTKYLLRRAMKGAVPDAILKRGKKGFGMPIAKWLTGPLRPMAEDMFSESRLKQDGFFEPAVVRQLFH